MATLTGQTIADSYEQLLSLPNGGLNGTSLVAITDGDSDTACALKIATTSIAIGATHKLGFDGTNTGTYISETANDILDFYSGGTHMLSLDKTNTEVVVNEADAGIDFRVESNDVAYMLIVDASNNAVGIGSSTVLGQLTVTSNTATTIDVTECPRISLYNDQDTELVDGDFLGRLTFGAREKSSSSTDRIGAYITAIADNTWTTNVETSAARLQFHVEDVSGSYVIATPAMTIDSGGNVGIGTVTPDVLFDVESTAGSNPTVAVFGDTSHNTGVFIMSQANNVNIQACAKNSHGTTTKLCLNPNGGNVGVGTDTPDTTLHISHPTTTIDYYENKGLLISEAGSADGLVMWSRTDSECYIGLNKDLSSGTGSLALGMNLDSNSNKQLALWIRESGRVGIGTSAPQYLMDVKIADGSNNLYTARFENADATDPNGIIIDHSGVDLSSDDTGDHEYLKCEDSNNTVFAVYGDGDLVNEDNSYTSDVRIKQDITDATSKLDDINKLKVRNYRYKDSNGEHLSGKLGEKRLGFIADELETVFPGLIRKKKVEKFGTAFSDLKCITWTPLVAVLVKAVQELSAKVTALENA